MVSERFRADETNAKLTRIGRTAGPRRREPADATRPAGLVDPAVRVAAEQPRPPASGGHDPAGRVIRGWSILGPAGVLRYPSTSLLRATPAPHLLYRRPPRQICRIGKVPAYRTLPAVHRSRHISVYSPLSHHSRETGHLPVNRHQPRSRMRGLGRLGETGQRPPISPREPAAPAIGTALREVTEGTDARYAQTGAAANRSAAAGRSSGGRYSAGRYSTVTGR